MLSKKEEITRSLYNAGDKDTEYKKNDFEIRAKSNIDRIPLKNINSSDFIIKKSGDNYEGIKGSSGRKVVSNSDFPTVLQYCNDNIGTSGKITVLTDVVWDTNVSLSAKPILIDLTNHIVTQSDDKDTTLLTMNRYNWIKNAFYDLHSHAFTGKVILFDGSNNLDSQGYMTGCSDIRIRSTTQQGTGIELFVEADTEEVGFITCHNITLNHLQYGIRINADAATGSAWINANVFDKIFICHNEYGIHISRDTGNANANCNNNHFRNVMIQSDNGEGGVDTNVYVEGRGNLIQGHVFDVDTEGAANLTSDSKDTYLDIGATLSDITDNGTDNMIIDPKESNIVLEHLNKDTTKNLTLFNGTSGNPYLYIYGDDSGSPKYGKMRVQSDGDFAIQHHSAANSIIFADGGDLELTPKTGGSNYVDLKNQAATAVTGEALSEFLLIKVNGVTKKLALIA